MKQEQKKNIQYDEHAKDILSQKIEGEPLVSKVSVELGETNRTFHGEITGNNTENTELGEGSIFSTSYFMFG